MTLDELSDAGCAVLISNPWNPDGIRWQCTLGHYMSAEWPTVSAVSNDLQEAIMEATRLALAARCPEKRGTVMAIYVPVGDV